MSTGSGITSIMSADTLAMRCLASCQSGVSTGDGSVEIPAVQQVPGLGGGGGGGDTYVHQGSTDGIEFLSEVGSIQTSYRGCGEKYTPAGGRDVYY